MSPQHPYRVAIVGTGGIASEHAEAITGLHGRATIVAAVDVDPSRLDEFARRWDIPARYGTLSELLAAEELDLVHICAPPAVHCALALECLRAGVSPLLEKPPALSLEEVDSLLEAEEKSGVPVAVVFQHRFGAGALRLRALQRSGTLGRALAATAHTLWFRDDEYFDVPWRGDWNTEGGGPTMGHGIHQFDLLLSILGEWDLVTALAGRQSRPTDTEDVSAAVVRFADGALATVLNSLVSIRQVSQLRIDYERASVELDHLYGYTDEEWTVTELVGETITSAWNAEPDCDRSGHLSQFRAIFDALDRGERPQVDLRDARRTMEFAAAVFASSFTGKPIARGEIVPGHPFYHRMQGTGAPWPTRRS